MLPLLPLVPQMLPQTLPQTFPLLFLFVASKEDSQEMRYKAENHRKAEE